MPRNTDSTGSLEIADTSVSEQFLTKLNDRLRRIGSVVTSTAAAAPAATIGQLQLDAPGPLSIQSNVAPVTTLPAAKQFSTMLVFLKQAPIGGSISLQLYAGGTAYGPLVSLSGTSVTVNLGSLAPMPANAVIRLDVVNAPSAFPGADLTVILR